MQTLEKLAIRFSQLQPVLWYLFATKFQSHPSSSLLPSLPADCYLLQIQQYNVVSSALKPKTEGAAIKADANQSDDSNMVAPATGQKEAPPQWYDIDVVKGTQYTVTGYQVPFEDPTMKVYKG